VAPQIGFTLAHQVESIQHHPPFGYQHQFCHFDAARLLRKLSI